MSAARQSSVVETYRARARNYDFTANLYYLIGFREWHWRKQAVRALRLRRGDTVVEVGCGTGLNFPLHQEAVGPEGRIIGLDLTDAMLDQARERVARHGWSNVELVNGDALDYAFPQGVNGIISTFALSLIPTPGTVIEKGAQALAPGGRWVVLDLQRPPWASDRAIDLLLPLVRPFGVDHAMLAAQPWEAIGAALRQSLSDVAWRSVYFDFIFLAAGSRRGD